MDKKRSLASISLSRSHPQEQESALLVDAVLYERTARRAVTQGNQEMYHVQLLMHPTLPVTSELPFIKGRLLRCAVTSTVHSQLYS